MPRRRERAFIWVPIPKDTRYSIEIDGVDKRKDIISAEFTRAIIGFESPCRINIIDTDGTLAGTYIGGETIELKMDFSDGTTSQWKGKLERPKKKSGDAYILELIGSHHQAELLDITVTEEYSGGTSADTILKSLVDTYLTGFTYTNVSSSTTNPTIKWNNKPFYDAVVELCNRAGFDCWVDSDKDFHFFERESINNDDMAIVWNDTLLEIEGLGIDTIDVKNRIIVYGEDEAGNPIVYQADDAASQTTYGIREKIIKDSGIRTYEQAKELAEAELASQKSTSTSGKVKTIIWPHLKLGYMTYIIHPIQKIHARYRVVKYTHFLPNEMSSVVVAKEKTLPIILKNRKLAEEGSESLINPFKMRNSYNFSFDDFTKIDQVLSDHITVLESNLKISTGTVGNMISNKRTSPSDITKVHLKVVGDALSGTKYYISTDDGINFNEVALESKVTVTAGKSLRVKINLNSASTLIDSFVVMYK